MIVLALDTATASTVAALSPGDGARPLEARDDPPPGARPDHAARLLELAERVLADAGVTWPQLDRIAVGVGPGGFTGLRIGVATARALAQAHGTPLVGVSSLRALAEGARGAAAGAPVLACIDARRGELFAAAWDAGGAELIAAAARPPAALAEAVAGSRRPLLAVGDGAVRYRDELEAVGAAVPPDGDRSHRITGAALCALGHVAEPVGRDALVPDYRRDPDAKPPRRP